jgi:1,4-dihydroxy-2-naphthoyl-CoA synthase
MSAIQAAGSFENITYEVKDSIGYIMLNRPKVMNALNRRTSEELNTAFLTAQNDAAVKGIAATEISLHFQEYEAVHTENSNKFLDESTRRSLRDSCLEVKRAWRHKDCSYAVTFACLLEHEEHA